MQKDLLQKLIHLFRVDAFKLLKHNDLVKHAANEEKMKGNKGGKCRDDKRLLAPGLQSETKTKKN